MKVVPKNIDQINEAQFVEIFDAMTLNGTVEVPGATLHQGSHPSLGALILISTSLGGFATVC